MIAYKKEDTKEYDKIFNSNVYDVNGKSHKLSDYKDEIVSLIEKHFPNQPDLIIAVEGALDGIENGKGDHTRPTVSTSSKNKQKGGVAPVVIIIIVMVCISLLFATKVRVESRNEVLDYGGKRSSRRKSKKSKKSKKPKKKSLKRRRRTPKK